MLWTLEEIGRLVSQSGNPAETLNNLVHLIKRRFDTDVCSVYLLEARPREPGAGRDDRAASRERRPRPHAAHRGAGRAGRRAAAAAGVADATHASALQVLPRGRRGSVPLVPRRPDRRPRPAAGRARRPDDRAARLQPGRCADAGDGRRAAGADRQRGADARAVRRAGAPAPVRAGAEPVVELGQRHDQPVPRARPGAAGASSTTTRSRCCSRFRSRRSRSARQQLALHSRINYAYRRMQEYLQVEAHLGRAARRRAVGAAGRLLLRRVRPARVAADLLRAASASWPAITSRARRTSASRWSASGSTTTRAISSSGSTSTAGSTRTTSTSTAGLLPIRPATPRRRRR